MSKRHHPKQVARVQQLLNGERSSLSITAYPSEAEYLERKYPVKLRFKSSVSGAPGVYWYKVVKIF